MGELASYYVLMGILRWCPDDNIPADTQAIQKALFKLSNWNPEILDESLFDQEGFSQKLEDELESIMMNESIGILGDKLETLQITDEFKQKYDLSISGIFSKLESTRIMKMGADLPKLLKKNESVRYKRLITQ